MSTIVAIDLGASSGRVLRGVFDGKSIKVEECARFSNGPIRVPDAEGGDYEWDLLSLWRGITDGLAEAARRGPVDAIGIDSWAVDYALLDEAGRLLRNPYSYRSGRTRRVIDEFFEAVDPAELYEHNGLQFQPFNSMFQILADRNDARADRACTLLLLPDLLAYWLTGVKVCEVTNASTMGLVDPRTRRWDPWVLEACGDFTGRNVEALLAPLVEPGEVIGTVNCEGLDLRTHSGEATPVIAVGSHDTASAVVAVPSVDTANFAFISSGTWSLVGMELNEPVCSPQSCAANITNELGVDGTVRYLKNIMGMWVQQECLRQWREESPEGQWDWGTLDAMTEAEEPFQTVFDINDPAFFTPGNMPERIQGWLEARGRSAPSSVSGVLRAVTESLVVAYLEAIAELRALSGQAIEVIHIVGGGSKNALLCQLTADATGLPVVAGPVEGTALGNMVVQLRAIGALEGGLDRLRHVVDASTLTRCYRPHAGQDQVWEQVAAGL